MSKDAVASSPDSWLEAINHIQITSPPEAAAAMVHFYGTVLGLRALPKPEELKAKGGLVRIRHNPTSHRAGTGCP